MNRGMGKNEGFVFLGDLDKIVKDVEEGNIFDFRLYVCFTESNNKMKMLAAHRGDGYTIVAVLPYVRGWVRTVFRFMKHNRLQFVEEHIDGVRLVPASDVLGEENEMFVYNILNDININVVGVYVNATENKPYEVSACSFPVGVFLSALAREKYVLTLCEERIDILCAILDAGADNESISIGARKYNILSLFFSSDQETKLNSKMLQSALLDANIEVADLLSLTLMPEAYIDMLAKLFIACVSLDGNAGNFLALCRLLVNYFDGIARNLVVDEPLDDICFRLTTVN